MRFIMTSASERTAHASAQGAQAKGDSPRTPRTFRSTPQTRRRNDLPDTTTIRVSTMSDNDLLRNKILDADPNRESHYRPPTLKGRILR